MSQREGLTSPPYGSTLKRAMERARRGFLIAFASLTVAALLLLGLQRAFSADIQVASAPAPEPTETRIPAGDEGEYILTREEAQESLINDAEAERAEAIALADPRVQALLAGHRYAVADASLDERGGYEIKKEGCPGLRSCAVVTIVDYTAALTHSVELSLESERVTAVSTWPTVIVIVSDDEASHAVSIAEADAEVQRALAGREYAFGPRGWPVENAGGPCSREVRHRCVMIMAQSESDWLVVVVDLTDEAVRGLHWEEDGFGSQPSEDRS